MEKNIVKEICDLEHLIQRYISNGFDPKRYFNLSQFQIIMYLFRHEDEDVCQKDLETEIHLKKATITACLDSMEDLGFVKRIQSDKDRRRNHVRLTEKALAVKNEFRSRSVSLNAELVNDVDENDLAAFYRVADMIKNNVAKKVSL